MCVQWRVLYCVRCVGYVVDQGMVCDSSDCIPVLVDCQGCCADGSYGSGVYGVDFVCWGCVSGRFMHEFRYLLTYFIL